MIKIVITGPESSGKSTLSRTLAKHYQAPLLTEYARTYLDQLDLPYREEDLLAIARGQVEQEDEATRHCPSLLLCDTSLLVICIWSQHKYGRIHPWIEQQWKQRPVDHYLLCRHDLPWEPDPQRENPHDRDELFALYQRALQEKMHTIISGDASARLKAAVTTIDQLLPS